MLKPRTLTKFKENLCLQTFLWGMGLSFLIFIPWLIFSGGYFFFYGDFNVQQIPFYQMIHDSIQNGNIGWSYTTDLGANIIGSYSFYMIGSPFFWLTMLFPSNVVPYMMAPLLMLKFGCISLAAYLFLRRYVEEQKYAMLGSLLYAFSGFGIYNIFFNHFHEAMITFPLMLAAMDAFIYEKRKGWLALSVFAAAIVNYYFFAGQAVFIFIYWCTRMITGSYRMTIHEFFRMVLEILLGFICTGAVIIPSIYAVIQNSRVSNFPHGWNAVVYSSQQRYLHIILSFFFPPDMPAYANFTPDSNAKWASVAAWLPLFSMVGVFSFYKLNTHKWLKKLIIILFVMAMVPFFNSMFQAMNAAYYARWFYMLTLMLTMATIVSLDHKETDFRPHLLRTFIITAIITSLIGFMPVNSLDDEDAELKFGLEKYPDRFWAWVGVAFIGLVALAILLCFRKNRTVFIRATAITLSVLIVGYGNLLIGVGVVNANYKYDFIAGYALGNKGVFDNKLSDLKNVRSDYYEAMDNMGMFWQIPTIQAFQSIVPGSVMDFYKSIGVERSVASRPETKVYGIRSLLSVKYLFDYSKDKKTFRNSLKTTEMPGWKYLMTDHGYSVYKNEYFIPYGFTYDEYITEDEYYSVSESNRHLLMLKAMVLSKEQSKKYRGILKHHSDLTSYNYTEEDYFKDCTDRNTSVCNGVKFENNRFTATFKGGKTDELVFFSIPYEPGWSATVNGQYAKIEKVNIGFMAVKVPAGKNSEIVFTYKTPGIDIGWALTGAGVVLTIVYMILWKTPARRKKVYMNYIEDDIYTPDIDLDMELFEEYEDDKFLIPTKTDFVEEQTVQDNSDKQSNENTSDEQTGKQFNEFQENTSDESADNNETTDVTANSEESTED